MGKVIEVLFPGNKCIDARIGDTRIKKDQAPKNGGAGSAPEPFQLFLASIATCAGMYALGFCHSRDLSTDGMSLKLFCEKNEQANRLERIVIKLKLPDGFPEKYKRPILRTMDQCSVKQLIINPPEFVMETEG